MKKRLVSLVLVIMMLFGMVSCQALESFIGYENLDQEYLDKYYPGMFPGTGDSGNVVLPDDGDQGNNDQGNNNQGSVETIPSEHASYAVHKDGYNLITFYWSNKNLDLNTVLSKCDIWVWWDGQDGKGWIWEPCEYGYRASFSVPDTVAEVGFIPRKNCTEAGGTSWGSADKDCGADDLFATIEGKDTFIYLRGGKNDANQYHSYDGGKTLQVIQKFNLAGMVDQSTIEYFVTPAVKLNRLSQVKVYDGDTEIAVTKISSLNRSSNSGKITVDAKLDVTKEYKIVIEGYGDKPVVPTDIFDTEYFATNYHYDGTDLGATINDNGTTTFKVWAPTASKVVLNLYKDGAKDQFDDSDKHIEMTRGEKGVWSYTAECGHGQFYTYSVTTSVGTQEAVDPYAKTAGVNGDRGMVVNLDLTDPEGWDKDNGKTFSINSYSEAIIWEIHIRDFSNLIDFGSEEANEKYQGKYLAFTQEGLVNEHGEPVGIDYLKKLGVNYVHLLPSYDYATVKEENPDSGFNWGYDPKNYNVPEGSYSTNPYDGVTRITEYKQMVQALHEAGIGVIMDVVYNHTYDKNASFNRIVPYYYYRYKSNGANSSGSGCGNDTASERYMYGKFMVESISYWQQEYHLDGFRFDLMGLHDMETMQKVESAVHKYDPQAIIYGEAWEMIVNQYGSAIGANQKNIGAIKPTNNAIGTIAVFNDHTRTGLKGESDDATKGYISGAAGSYERSKVLFGVNGGVDGGPGWRVPTGMVVNYLSAHDNTALWDKLKMSVGHDDSTLQTRLKMNRLGATILFASKGIVFFQAGEEILRSKPLQNSSGEFVYDSKGNLMYDHNSYKSSDEVNNLRWEDVTPDSNEYKMMQYYAGLCAIRTKMSIFTQYSSFNAYPHNDNKGFNIVMTDNKGGVAIVVFNPEATRKTFNISYAGNFNVICDGTNAGVTSLNTVSGSVNVPGYSAIIIVNDQVLNSVGK